MPQFTLGPALLEAELHEDPLEQFQCWLAEAESAAASRSQLEMRSGILPSVPRGFPAVTPKVGASRRGAGGLGSFSITPAASGEPAAMALATADARGRPSVRMMLYKGMHHGGLSFYSNYESRKASELAANPNAALLFWWNALQRQLRVEGRVEPLPREISRRYFRSRPRDSQLGAYTSHQSRECDSRTELDERFEENARRFAGRAVPCPPHWGGYRLIPDRFEFWQARPGRFHDRIAYLRKANGWRRARLEP